MLTDAKIQRNERNSIDRRMHIVQLSISFTAIRPSRFVTIRCSNDNCLGRLAERATVMAVAAVMAADMTASAVA